FEGRLRAKEAEAVEREKGMREREEAVRRARESVEATVMQMVREERAKIVAEEAKKAKLVLGAELEAKGNELVAMQMVLQEKEQKLAAAQKAEAEVLVMKR